MRRADRQMDERRRHDDRRRAHIRCESVDRLDLEDLRAHRLDDLPSAHARAKRHRCRCRELDPERHVHRVLDACGHQREDDDAHRFLRVVRAMRESLEHRCDDLTGAESFVYRMRTAPGEDHLEQPHDTESNTKRQDRRQDQSFQDVKQAAAIHIAHACTADDCTGQGADERMR